MPHFTTILGDRDAHPLTPIPETEQKDPLGDGSLNFTKSDDSMPSMSDSDSASPPSSRNSSTPSSPVTTPPTVRRVSFPDTESPVTSMSRPLNNAELWPLYHFEQHARACRDCFNPYAVHKEGKSLCTTGQDQGATVAQIIYSKCDGQDIFAVSDRSMEEITRVELPRQYVQVRSLLRAVERIVKARRRPERRKVVDREDESKQRELARERNPSPDRSPRQDDSRSTRRYYRSSSPSTSSDDSSRHSSPVRASRTTVHSYHESELPLRRTSSSPSSYSTSPSRSPSSSGTPIEVHNRSPSSSRRPSPTPVQSPDAPKTTIPLKQPAATYPPSSSSTLPLRRRSLTDGTSNSFPVVRRSSISGPPTSSAMPPSAYRHSSSVPFRTSPLAGSSMVRSPGVPSLNRSASEGDVVDERGRDGGDSDSREGKTSKGMVRLEVRRPGRK
ncbi:MAG: hypothetical protein Q9162_003331 [Coniocarpon cinnabarinum]